MTQVRSIISTLRKIAGPPAPRKQAPVSEKCFFCGRLLPEDHRHVIDFPAMKFMCTCEMCMITMAEAKGYKPLPRRFLEFAEFNMPDELWADFLIPVNMAFMVVSSSRNGAVAYYPGPAGATESKLKMIPWEKLVELNPILTRLEPDLEALLINRLNDTAQYFIAPLDSCYELIGRIRITWKGIFGGKEVNDTINEFFERLSLKSTRCQI